jgi:quercetin dioxygenase-like cupin family protein
MQITPNGLETNLGPPESFTGSVFVDRIATPSDDSPVGVAAVHFAPGAHTAWHTHPHGQTIWITEGIGLCQSEGGPIETIRPGDRIFFEPGENHWHGAAPTRFMTHIAIQQADNHGSTVAWGHHLTDDEYGQAPSLDGSDR